jgi:hypothetical protein
MAQCETCKANLPSVAKRTKSVNDSLWRLGLTYYEFVPLMAVNAVLERNGFSWDNQPGFMGGASGRIHTEVGDGKWLTLSWYKMESGRYELVAYVN